MLQSVLMNAHRHCTSLPAQCRAGWCRTLSGRPSGSSCVQATAHVFSLPSVRMSVLVSLRLPRRPFDESGLAWAASDGHDDILILLDCR
jgi:hypothetical protein